MQVSSSTTTAVGDGNNIKGTIERLQSDVGPVETGEGNISIIPNPISEESTVQKGKKKGVDPLDSSNSDNWHTKAAEIEFGVVS